MTRLPIKEKVAYGLAAIPEGFYSNVLNITLMFVMYNYMKIDAKYVAWAFCISRIYDAITDPLMGWLCDRTKTRWGCRKPYILAGFIITGLALFAIFSFPRTGHGELWYFGYVTLMMLLYHTGTTILCVPYSSMCMVMTDDYNERTNLLSFKMMFSSAAGMIMLPWIFKFISLPYFNGDWAKGAQVLSIIGMVLGFAFLLPLFFLIPNFPEKRLASAPVENKKEKISLSDIFSVLKVRPFLILLTVEFCTLIGIFIVSSLGGSIGLYYVTNNDSNLYGTISGVAGTVTSLCCLAAVPAITWLSKFTGKRNGLIWLSCMGIFGYILMFFMNDPRWPWLMVGAGTLPQISVTAFWLLNGSMATDLVDYDALYNHKHRPAIFSSIMGWVSKFCIASGMLISGYLINWTGFDVKLETAQADGVFFTMRLCMSLIPAIGLVLAIFALLRFPLTKAKIDEIHRQLEAKKAAENLGV